MKLIALAALVGYLSARLLWVALHPVLTAPTLTRSNYRGRTLVTGAGAVLPLALLLVEGIRIASGGLGAGRSVSIGEARLLTLAAAWGFGTLGLVDDLFGRDHERGFGGHFHELRRGRLTTGGLKAVGGAALALIVVSPATPKPAAQLFVDAALVALSANLGNLFDRRPGRVTKIATVVFVVLVGVTHAAHVLLPVAVVIGAGLGLFRDDLHEHLMLGDAGANVLGAVLGLATVMACSTATRIGALVVVTLLNLLSEVVSFSNVVDAVAPLRFLDGLGRRV
jgi:UDP-N-acetylmuramyl pentapeptide phosphotransferase/UDP-N-acetylglucosamine-1-phosphate transferase